MMRKLTKKPLFAFLVIVGLLFSLQVGLKLAGKRQDIRNRAAGSSMTLSIYPANETVPINGTRTFELKATFANGSPSEKLGYFKTEIDITPLDTLQMPVGQYVDTSKSGFTKIFRVDGPDAVNPSGKIIIELGADAPGTGPSTDQVVTIAKFTLAGKKATSTSGQITLSAAATEVKYNQTPPASIPTTLQPASYTVTGSTNQSCLTLPTYDTFDEGKSINTDLWDFWGSSNGFATQSAGLLQTSVASGNGFAGEITKNKICGDFDVNVDFNQFTSSGQSEADVRLSVEDQSNNSTVFIEKYSKGNDQGFHSAVVIGGVVQGNGKVGITATSGKLRIRRIGNSFTTYYNVGSGWYILLPSSNGFTSDVQPALIVKSFDQNPSVSANFDNFNLTSAIPDSTITVSPPATVSATISGPPACKEGVDKFTVRESCVDPSVDCPNGGPCATGDSFRFADVFCYDGYLVTLGDSTSCKSSSDWKKSADSACLGHVSCVLTPTPTPPSGRDQYTIDVGDKLPLSIDIAASVNPQIRFKAKLASVSNTPDLYIRLRVKDDLAFTNNQSSQTPTDSCNDIGSNGRDFYVPVKATGGIYSPVQQISQPAPTGAKVASVTPDGWVILDGVVPGRYSTLYLKGPKTRRSKEAEHILIQPGQIQSQDYDWTSIPLDPGDLPNPDHSMKQDCTINSTDWSLVKRFIGSNKTNQSALDVSDVNYDGQVNALDSIAILGTLGKRPDDDQ